MQTAEAFDKERLEVDSLLASGIFSRAPNLEHLLKYICEKYFEGSAEEIKEYTIAVEALGRRPEFDQKRDSIVRVEAHRLRKRLKEYYENEGSHREVQIEIPSGQYTPRFVFVNPPLPAISALQEKARPEGVLQLLNGSPAGTDFAAGTAIIPALGEVGAKATPLPESAAFPGHWVRWLVISLAILFLAGATLFAINRGRQGRVLSSANAFRAALPGETVRILCGVESGSYTDSFERVWGSDRYYTGGAAIQSPRSQIISGTRDQQLYRSRREGNFRYDIPLQPGTYELRLYFAETMFGDNNAAGGGETTRLFQIRLNGKTIETYFDVIADAGAASTADVKVFRDISPAADGQIHLEFQTDTNVPFLNAIDIQPGVAGMMRPYRIAARDHGLTDSQGRTWDPDHFARGGQLIVRPYANVQHGEPELFRSERFGNISYTLPVAQEGRYTVNLYFAENWFGPGNPGGGGIGSRTFDILVNGEMLRKNFDILKDAGGVGRATIVSKKGIEPTHQGKIAISLVPNQNYAAINALEVIDESR
jgi:hypothetical protein